MDNLDLTEGECSEIMQLYIKATPVEDTLEELEGL